MSRAERESGEAAVGFRLMTAHEARQRLREDPTLLVLDVRRRAAFEERPEAVPGAVPVLLDEDPLRLPREPPERPMLVYCLCHGEASSSRVARWLVEQGQREVAVLQGGVDAWKQRGYPVEPIRLDRRQQLAWRARFVAGPGARAPGEDGFLPRLVSQRLLEGHELPLRRTLSVLFVDMADSTRLLGSHSTENVLRLVQAFMAIVVEVGALHCGDVHDFEGDGALLYFEGAGEAVPAAFELRERLLALRRTLPELPVPRLALDEGPLVVGLVGGRFRRAVALVGPAVPRAARILKLAPPGGIIVTHEVLERARETSPDLARCFEPMPEVPPLRGFEHETLLLHVAPPPGSGHP